MMINDLNSIVFQGQDFSEDKLMNSGNLYSLYLLNSDSTDNLGLENGVTPSPMVINQGVRIKKEISDDEEIDVENDSGKNEAASPRCKRKASQVQENGEEKAGDALFEGMPFYELQGKEVGKQKSTDIDWRFQNLHHLYPGMELQFGVFKFFPRSK